MRRLIVVSTVALLAPLFASAQSVGGFSGGTDPFTISISPQYPAPYSTATLSFASSMIDLTTSTLSVSANGKRIYTGGVRPVAVPLGAAGQSVLVSATVTDNGAPYTVTTSLQPEDVALVMEPLASTPPLYPGKASIPLGGNTRLVAIAGFKNASGRALSPSTLAYTWTVDGTRVANASGIGKSSIEVSSPLQYRTRTVEVMVETPDGALMGGASVSLSPKEPTVRLYATDPLLGIRYDHALSTTFTIPGVETSLYAAPFSLPSNLASVLTWFLNGKQAQTGNTITLRPSGSGQGSASLSFTAAAGDTTPVTASLPLSFGSQQSTNIFGL